MKKIELVHSIFIEYCVPKELIKMIIEYLPYYDEYFVDKSICNDILMANTNDSFPNVELTNGLIASYNIYGKICIWNPVTVQSIGRLLIKDVICTRKYPPKIYQINYNIIGYCYYSYDGMTLLIIGANDCIIHKTVPLIKVQRRKTVFGMKEIKSENKCNELHIFYKSRIRIYDMVTWLWIRTEPHNETLMKESSPEIAIKYYKIANETLIKRPLIMNDHSEIFAHTKKIMNKYITDIYMVPSNCKNQNQTPELIYENIEGFSCSLIPFDKGSNKNVIVQYPNNIYVIDYINKKCILKVNVRTNSIIIYDNNFMLLNYDGIYKYDYAM